MKFFGVPNQEIFQGLYCSNQHIFKKGKTISKRQKNFLFVGNLVKKKGVAELVSSFKFFLNSNSDWKLIIVGNGPLKKIIPKHENIEYFNNLKTENQQLTDENRRLEIVSPSGGVSYIDFTKP